MKFDIQDIGKLVLHKTKQQTLYAEPSEFEFIVAYDYTAQRYLSVDLSRWNNIYCTVPNDAKLYTLEEALLYIDSQLQSIHKEKEKLQQHFSRYIEVCQAAKATNYQNELLHLSNAYYDTMRQQNDIVKYLDKAKTVEEKKQLSTELLRTKKGIRRLKKRFHFFFGDDAEIIQGFIQDMGTCQRPTT